MAEERAVQILIADDNEVNQRVIRAMLETEGYLVSSVFNGTEAIQAMESGIYDLIIMDCLMPVMDGFTAASTIRNHTTGNFDPDVPILGVSSLSSSKDRAKCLDSGMNDSISKPVDAAELVKRITRLLNDTSSSGTSPLARRFEPPVKSEGTACGSSTATAHLPDIMQSLSHILLRDAEIWRRELEAFVTTGSVSDLGALAHKIRGTADVLGNQELSRACSRLEAAAGTGNLDQVPGLTESIITELTGLIAEVKTSSNVKST